MSASERLCFSQPTNYIDLDEVGCVAKTTKSNSILEVSRWQAPGEAVGKISLDLHGILKALLKFTDYGSAGCSRIIVET